MNPQSSHSKSGDLYGHPPRRGGTDAEGWLFTVWAPEKKTMILHLLEKAEIPMLKDEDGYFQAIVRNVQDGDRYFYRPDGEKDYPDPVSFFQPDGVHGPSSVVDHGLYEWQDSNWQGLAFDELVMYELHVGTFTPEGTFEAAIPRLEELAELGINAIELMPVAQCPGSRNWGYDGVFPYAVQHSYGGPSGLKKMVDACHAMGMAVFLDVVYNHLGREGNNIASFGPYFSSNYQTPWGKALNFDGAFSDGVREYIINNVLHWAEYYHIDGLRLDAIHEVFDRNAITLWDLLHTVVKEWEKMSGKRLYLIAESDLNSPRVIRPPETGGYGLDAQWLDDFHHSLNVLLDEQAERQYPDYGGVEQLAKAYEEGFIHSGDYMRFRQRRHGASSAGLPGSRFIVFNQNHDLPGNRPGGERSAVLVSLEKLQLAAAVLLLSPYIPMLFMGEEYGEEAPFYFFSDYQDMRIADELRKSRKRQMAGFGWKAESPDPQEKSSFLDSKLRWEERKEGRHGKVLNWHRRLIQLRKSHPLLRDLSKAHLRVELLTLPEQIGGAVPPAGLAVHRQSADGKQQLICLYNFSKEMLIYTPLSGDQAPGGWTKLLDAGQAHPETLSAGEELLLSPWAAVVYEL